MSFKIGDRVRAKHDHSFVAVIGSSLAMRDKPPFSLTVEFGGLLYDAPASWFERVPEVRVECACGFAHFCKAAPPPETPEPSGGTCAKRECDHTPGFHRESEHDAMMRRYPPPVKPEVPA